MLQLLKTQRDWRILIWILLLVSIFGPWFFDKLYIPSEYTCSVRLDENFCGTPVTGIWVLSAIFLTLVGSVVDLVKGAAVEYDAPRAFLICLLGLSLVLPFVSTLLVITRGDRRPRLAFHMIACSLALSVSLAFGLMLHFKRFWLLWGIWLYVAALASALILEVFVLVQEKRQPLAIGSRV